MRAFRSLLALGLLALPAVTVRADAPKPDSGKFTLIVRGMKIGTDTFRLLPDGCDSDVQVSAGQGREIQFHQNLRFKKGQWTEVTTEAGALGTMTIKLAGDKSTLKAGDKAAVVQKLPATVYPFGNSSPHLFAFLISAYDTHKGGEQKFSLVFSEGVGPQGITVLPATMKAPETRTKQVNGKAAPVTRYQIALEAGSAPIAMEVLADKEGHVLFWTVPAQSYTAVRDGFQSLASGTF